MTNGKQIVPRMPTTTLSLDDIALAEKIITYKVGDLWVSVFDQGRSSDSLEVSQQTALSELGNDLLGTAGYLVYSSTSDALDALEQLAVDL